MRIYISGPITGDPDYARKFSRAAEALRAKGLDYINPAELPNVAPGLSWAEYIKLDLRLIDHCDAIMFLKGWASSAGCCKEAAYAKGRGLPVYHLYGGGLTND